MHKHADGAADILVQLNTGELTSHSSFVAIVGWKLPRHFALYIVDDCPLYSFV